MVTIGTNNRYELKNQSVFIRINVYLLFRMNINYNIF